MNPQDDFSLTNGGDCFSHWHSEDRVPTHDFLIGLQSTAKVEHQTVSFSVDLAVDYYIVDTSAGAVVATLPPANGNRVITLLRTEGSASVSVYCSGSETVNGTTHIDIISSYSPVRLLAIKGVGYVQV